VGYGPSITAYRLQALDYSAPAFEDVATHEFTASYSDARVGAMDYTPEDMEAVQACLDGIHRNVPVSVEPAAAALLLPHTVYSVADLLALTEWPAWQLRLIVERWQPDVDVRVERIR
jgi:hypothetical protein